MTDFLFFVDTTLFTFLNQTLSTAVSDQVWPFITDYSSFLTVRILLAAIWLLLLVRGGKRGRTVALLLVPVVVLSDYLSSAVIKDLVGRARPCHVLGGNPVLPAIHLLVDCGPGKSFPSSHAVNNFAVATVFAVYYPKWTWPCFAWAFLVGISRVAVGVHYPSDVGGGALIGILIALCMIGFWTLLTAEYWPALQVGRGKSP